MSGARFFRWVQGAGFYRALYADAAALVPHGNGARWLDVGCGPGLLTRIAAERGYDALGVDTSRAMIELARAEKGTAAFEVRPLDALVPDEADVVSAASLLAVLPDRAAGLEILWSAVRPGGVLLILEPTQAMTPRNAWRAIAGGLPGPRPFVLWLWARARRGSTVEPELVRTLADRENASLETASFLQGMVIAWLLHKPTAPIRCPKRTFDQ